MLMTWNGLKSNVKLFTDDTYLFLVVKNEEKSATISKWAYNWKMPCNSYPQKNHAGSIVL